LTVKLYNLTGKYYGDRLSNIGDTIATYSEIGAGGYDYVTATQTFVANVFGDWTVTLTTAIMTNDSASTDVEAELITVDIIPENNIMARTTNDYLYMMTGIADNTITIRKYSDFFTQKNDNIYDVIRLYNDGQEVNSAVTTAVFGGSRSSIVHSDIPVRSGDVKGFAIGLETKNEAVIKSIKIVNEDLNVGGDR